MTADLLTVIPQKVTFFSLVLNNSLLNYMTTHLTSLIQLAIFVLFLMNI